VAGYGLRGRDLRTSDARILSVLSAQSETFGTRLSMEPLFVANDFGRGFDSRRLHHKVMIINDLYGARIHKPVGLSADRNTINADG